MHIVYKDKKGFFFSKKRNGEKANIHDFLKQKHGLAHMLRLYREAPTSSKMRSHTHLLLLEFHHLRLFNIFVFYLPSRASAPRPTLQGDPPPVSNSHPQHSARTHKAPWESRSAGRSRASVSHHDGGRGRGGRGRGARRRAGRVALLAVSFNVREPPGAALKAGNGRVTPTPNAVGKWIAA